MIWFSVIHFNKCYLVLNVVLLISAVLISGHTRVLKKNNKNLGEKGGLLSQTAASYIEPTFSHHFPRSHSAWLHREKTGLVRENTPAMQVSVTGA